MRVFFKYYDIVTVCFYFPEQYDYSQSDGPIVNEKHQSPQLSYPDFLVGFPTQAGQLISASKTIEVCLEWQI